MPSQPLIAISAGDPLGIGPEVVVKALADPAVRRLARFRVFGPARVLTAAAQQSGLGELWRSLTMPGAGVEVHDLPFEDPPPASGSADQPGPTREGGRVSHLALMQAISAAKHSGPGAADAIVTAPIAKAAWKLAGIDFPGHTEVLAHEFAAPRSAMLFVGPSLRVILVTIHIPLSEAPRVITVERVWNAIDLGARACVELGVARPRIAVAGLNPHAGEGGLFGQEDAQIIAPAVAQARRAGLDVHGPLPGDAVFLAAAKGRYDLVVAMYHDQGLIPVKLLDREAAVNVTVGLSWPPGPGPEGGGGGGGDGDGGGGGARPVIRTSPAHGVAYDIAGRGVADPQSMKSAIVLAAQMISRRGGRGAAGEPGQLPSGSATTISRPTE